MEVGAALCLQGAAGFPGAHWPKPCPIALSHSSVTPREQVRAGKSGRVACNTTTFGGDPIWYRTKSFDHVSN